MATPDASDSPPLPMPRGVKRFAAGFACEEPCKFSKKHYPNGLNANFLAANGAEVVTSHIGKFEDPEKRDIAKALPDIMTMLCTNAGLSESTSIADIGAGTGLFLDRLANAAKQVFAMEISPHFVQHLRKKAEEGGLKNVEVVEGTIKDPCLPKQSIDVALVCDVYHHFEYPRTVCEHLREALRPDGRLVIIDFIRDEAVHKSHPPGWILDHVRAGQEVFRQEIVEAGFTLVEEPSIASLAENYCMIFKPTGSE